MKCNFVVEFYMFKRNVVFCSEFLFLIFSQNIFLKIKKIGGKIFLYIVIIPKPR